MTPTAQHRRLRALLPVSRHAPIPAADLANMLGTSRRKVGSLVEELIEAGELIGSSCDADAPGYFLIVDETDLAVGTRHTVNRAAACFRRVRRLQRAAAERFGAQTATLFDLDEVKAPQANLRGLTTDGDQTTIQTSLPQDSAGSGRAW